MGLGIVAGAMQGAGEAGVAVGLQLQKQFGQEELLRMRTEADKELQASMQSFHRGENLLTREHAETLQGKGFQHAETLQGLNFAHSEALQDLGFTHAEELAKARMQFDKSEHAENRKVTREQIASHERISVAHNKVALEIANIGGVIQQDTQGNVLWVGKDGKAHQIMDPNNNEKPLVGFKDLTPAAKAYAEVLKAQLVDQDRMEQAGTGDVAAINTRRAALNAQLLNVLTGGIGAVVVKPAAGPQIKDPFKTGDTGKPSAVGATAKAGIVEGQIAASAGGEKTALQKREAELRAEYDKEEAAAQARSDAYKKEFGENLERTKIRREL